MHPSLVFRLAALLFTVARQRLSAAGDTLLQDREVACFSDRMMVNLAFRRPFGGLVFVQGQFGAEQCRWPGNGGHYLLIVLQLANDGQQRSVGGPLMCGVRQNGSEYSATLVVSPEQILTQQALALDVSCAQSQAQQQQREQLLTVTLGSTQIDAGFRTIERESAIALVGTNPPAPKLAIAVLSGHGLDGEPLTEAQIGQRLTLDVALDRSGAYDMFVHDCLAHDGTNHPDASVPIIGPNGCVLRLPRAVDGPVLVSPGHGQKHVFVHLYGFQFATNRTVHFQCQVTVCLAPCGISQCEHHGSGGTSPPAASPSGHLSSHTLRTDLLVRPQPLTPISRPASARFDRLQPGGESPPAERLLGCSDLAWLLLLCTLGVLLCVAVWTIFSKLLRVATGIYRAIKA